MKDTSTDMDQRYRAMLMQRTGEERLKMGCADARDGASWLRHPSGSTIHRPRLRPFAKVCSCAFTDMSSIYETRAKILAAIEFAGRAVSGGGSAATIPSGGSHC